MLLTLFENLIFKEKAVPVFLRAVLEFPLLAFTPLFILFFCGPFLIPEIKHICWNKKVVIIFCIGLLIAFCWHYVLGGYMGLKEMKNLNDMGVRVTID